MPVRSSLWVSVLFVGLFLATVLLIGWGYTLVRPIPDRPETRYGITFSSVYARALGLDPITTYTDLLSQLGVRAVRIPVYWSEIEPRAGEFVWDELDALVLASEQSGTRITLVVGMKVPRWPECHLPDWVEMDSAPQRQQAVLRMLEQVVKRYRDSTALERWQVENEPLFPFGECPSLTAEELIARVDLVRDLDPDHPIQLTVSGENGSWQVESDLADVLGVSLYRLTWNDLFGYFLYPLSPEYYAARARLVKGRVDQVVISELQAEPWFPEPRESRTLAQWYQVFDAQLFAENLQFVEEAGLPEVYLWGAEWWYLLHQQGDDRLWDVAVQLWK